MNGEIEIYISKSGDHKLLPSIGLGYMFPSAFYNMITLHSGLHYSFKNWGVGMEANGFTGNPFWGYDSDMYVDINLYPNINYNIPIKSRLYFKLSAGIIVGFNKSSTNESDSYSMDYIGKSNLGIGLSFGYKFGNRFRN